MRGPALEAVEQSVAAADTRPSHPRSSIVERVVRRTPIARRGASRGPRVEPHPFDYACAPGYPGPPSGHSYLPSRFCVPCSIETSEPTCFVCGRPTAATMPRGWYRGNLPEPPGTGDPRSLESPSLPGP